MTASATGSGRGAVAAIAPNNGTIVRRKFGHRSSVYPLVASTACRAETVPVAVCTLHPAPILFMASARVPPCTAAPAPSAARASPRIAQGIQVSAATVQHRDPVTPGTGRALEARALQQLDRSAAACKLFGGNGHQRRRLHPYRRAQRPVSTCITTNAMALDEIENELRCAASEGVHAAAQFRAELTLHLVRIDRKSVV